MRAADIPAIECHRSETGSGDSGGNRNSCRSGELRLGAAPQSWLDLVKIRLIIAGTLRTARTCATAAILIDLVGIPAQPGPRYRPDADCQEVGFAQRRAAFL